MVMTKCIFVCAVSLAFGSPAMAGDRPGDKVASANGLMARSAGPLSDVRRGLPAKPSFERFSLPVDTRKLEALRIRSIVSAPISHRSARRYDLAAIDNDEQAQVLKLSEITAGDGGRYAVRETLSDYRKPRFRRSALGTMLTLRIDGEAESPAFSVGGGGVAAIVWQAVPKS
ncbi:hypothetical protein [Sphingomonas sp. S2-65]|uniref:hypothetical protein n=1 Tax=Sphingomonas sp. S2-65 TaxID=2903960 RepID=UPI001F260CE8|nr:hypothetical protein [Sphingomonas sp. S2-65]UYY59029.1 hypothetical protein LZ586_02700 [Sphingomonas sp. S2-65]